MFHYKFKTHLCALSILTCKLSIFLRATCIYILNTKLSVVREHTNVEYWAECFLR